jgi:AAA family ATP:ADP antiporter
VLLDLREQRAAESPLPSSTAADPVLKEIVAVRSGDLQAALPVLFKADGISPALVPHVIPLLADDGLGDYALFALRKIAEEHVGELTDALLDPNQPVEARRRLARVFSVCVSQRAADGLLLALADERFDVRWQAVRSLTAIVEKNPRVVFDRQRIEASVLEEIETARPIWESQRLLAEHPSDAPIDAFLRERAARSLAHVFGLLSLVLPRDPLQIAFRSLHAEDHHLRGTALEYLEGVLPAPIRQHLWPFLVRPRHQSPAQPRTAILADLLRANPSLTLIELSGQTPTPRPAGFSAA